VWSICTTSNAEVGVSSDEIRNQGPVRNARSKLGGSSTWLALVEDEDDDENEDDNGEAA
jgi:hypothetical protein